MEIDLDAGDQQRLSQKEKLCLGCSESGLGEFRDSGV